MIAPFIIVLPAVYQGMLNEVLALKVYAICVTLLHLHYGVCVVSPPPSPQKIQLINSIYFLGETVVRSLEN